MFVCTRSFVGCFLSSTYTLAELYHRSIFGLFSTLIRHSDPVPLGTGFFLLLRDGAKLLEAQIAQPSTEMLQEPGAQAALNEEARR